MSILQGTRDPARFFEESLQLLEDYQWIFTTSNTKFVKEKLLECFPSDWKHYFTTVDNENLNSFPDGLNDKNGLPDSLKQLQEKLNSLNPKTNTPNIQSQGKPMKGMSPKKSHEIVQLSKLITQEVGTDANLLIDFGSGLGYLSEVLYKSKRFQILGLECDSQRVYLARKRQKEYYPESTASIVYETMTITPESGEQVEELCKSRFADNGSDVRAIIGLHACADLSITAMKLFLKTKSVQKLIIMPCCYHKLELSESSGGQRIFKHFPLSVSLQNIVAKSPRRWQILNRPFLRLACQQTVSRWRCMSEEDHRKHGWEMFIRGVAECLADENEEISKIKGRRDADNGEAFACLSNRYHLISKDNHQHIEWKQEHRKRAEVICYKYADGVKLSEGLTCLQTALQGLCERIVLLDRVCFMEEMATSLGIPIVVDAKKILDDKLSPRCFAFVAVKLSNI